MSVDTIHPTDLLDAPPWSLGVRYNYIANAGVVPWGGSSLCAATGVVGAFSWVDFLLVVTIIL